MGEIGFLRIGLDPGRVGRDHGQNRRARVEIAADLDVVDLGGDAVDRRLDFSVLQIVLSLIEHSGGLHVGGEFLQRQIGRPQQPGEPLALLLLQLRQLRLRSRQRCVPVAHGLLVAKPLGDDGLVVGNLHLAGVDNLLGKLLLHNQA